MKLSHILRAVATSWLAVLFGAVVGFFLTPYLLHHIGDVEFGLYTLVTTVTGYYGLFDLGVRSAVLRFVSRALALNDREEINRVLASASISIGEFVFSPFWRRCFCCPATAHFWHQRSHSARVPVFVSRCWHHARVHIPPQCLRLGHWMLPGHLIKFI